MDWKKIAPWNWFEDEESRRLPTVARRGDPFEAFRAELDRMFERGLPALRDETGKPLAPLRPNVDISEGRKSYKIEAELPGVEEKDVSVEVEGRTLVLRGERRREKEEEEEGRHWVERSYGAIQRVLTLPEDADAENIEAKFKNGVLKLRVPKHEARATRSRRIEIQPD